MSYNDKLKIRLYMAIVLLLAGICMILTGILINNDFLSPFGTGMAVIGLARIVQYIRIKSNPDVMNKQEIAETDERNIMLWTKARSLTLSISVVIGAVAVCVLYIIGKETVGNTVAYCVLTVMVIYLICRAVLNRKY